MIKPDTEYSITNDFDKLINKEYELLIDSDGDKFYLLNGLPHRENAPATIFKKGYKDWILYDKYYRLNGPAIEYVNGNKLYCINDKFYEENEYWKEIFSKEEYIKMLIKFCPICEEYFEFKENVAVHLDQEIETGKFTPDLQNNVIINKRIELIIKSSFFRLNPNE